MKSAACHIAIGSAYKFCLEDGLSMSEEELAQIGCNESMAHTDIMLSSEEVSVIATTYEGKNIELIINGFWASGF